MLSAVPTPVPTRPNLASVVRESGRGMMILTYLKTELLFSSRLDGLV